jgi:hypothetical protein
VSSRRFLLLGMLMLPATGRGEPSERAGGPAGRFPQPVRVGDLIGRRVLLPRPSQPSLGRVRAVVTQAGGQVAVVMGYGGFLGVSSRAIVLPVAALTLLGEHMVLQGMTVAQLDSLPDFDPSGTMPLPPDAVIQVGLSKPPH